MFSVVTSQDSPMLMNCTLDVKGHDIVFSPCFLTKHASGQNVGTDCLARCK